MAARKCTLCSNETNSCYVLCTVCALEHDQCQQCRVKMNLGVPAETVAAIVEFRNKKDTALAEAQKALDETLTPLKDAIASYRKEDEDLREACGKISDEPNKAYYAALDELKAEKEKQRNGQPCDVELSQKKVDEAGAAAREANGKSQALAKQLREATKYATERETVSQAHSTFSNKRWKAQRIMDAETGRILGHLGVELGYAEEMKRIAEQS
jgi:flagellar biosynthesis chaperone FliJ